MVNITYLDNATTLFQIILVINSDTGELFVTMILLSFAFILFIATKQFPTPSVLLFVSFVTGMLAYALWVASLIQAWVLIVPVAIAILTIIFIGITSDT